MRRLGLLILVFLVGSFSMGYSQVYTMGNLGTVNNACGGLFYDSQGPSAQYQNNEFFTATFCAPAGQVITFTFTDFATEAGWDFLDVYNGPSTASALLGSYTGAVGPGVISSSIGGCLTFVFDSDGSIFGRGWEAAISCGNPPPVTNNGDVCPNATPFCTGATYTFNNNVNVPSLGTIGCLFTSPNPVWYYMEIENPGDLAIDIAQFDVFNVPIDVDFILWGPFSSLPNGCTQIQNSTAPVVDCSYSASAFEQANITGAQTGEIYILLLTNFENTLGYITFNSSAGSTATTNCDILCNITALSTTPTACNPTTNTYNVSGQLTVTNPPQSGILTFTSSCGGTTTVSAPFPSQISYTITGINAAAGSCNVVASFSADPSCTITEAYIAPSACASVSLNCPDYANTSTSPTVACSNQTYYLDVVNTACAGQIFFTVAGNYGSLYGNEISWTVTSNLSGSVLASGFGNTSSANFTTAFGPFNPAIHGTIFTLNVNDAFGDGFDGTGGVIRVLQGNAIIAGPIAGEIGFGASTIFGANISISPATITISTPSGNVIQTVQNCNDFRVPISIENANFCNTISATLPWIVTCNTSGATLATGSNTLTVYPTLPTSTNDVVSIQYNTSACNWEVTGNNDCDAGDIGTIFTISPNPSTLSATGCIGGNQDFDVTYIGLGGGPNCCSTGGALIPIQINNPYPQGSYAVASSPFGGINNSAYLNIPPNTVGGNATSLQLNINMSGFCMDPAGPNAGANLSYWVTVLIDGQIVSDLQTANPGPANYSQTMNLAAIPGGFNSSMNIEVYIYPNVFANSTFTQFQTYNPTANCASLGNGIWTASSITANLAVTFEEFSPTAASCLYPTIASFSCCSPSLISNASSTICSGGSTTAITTWQNAVAAANPTCVVYSSVLPIAGTTLPNNILPSGINNTASATVQNVNAYAYCDADNSSTINAGDTYTLISSYNLTVNPTLSAGSNGSTAVCASGSSVNLFSILGGTPSNAGTWSGPSTVSGGNLGTFNPSSNSAGVYTYTVTGTSPCPNATATATVTIVPAFNASISYTGSPFCKNITTAQIPTIIGSAGGLFSSAPAGLSLNSSTGAIVPSTSTAGTYTISYSNTPGLCPVVAAFATIEIVNVPNVNTNLPSYSTCTGPTLATAGAYTINITSTTPGATFNWSGSDGNSGTGTPINYPIANNTCSDQTVTFTINSSFNGCSSAPITRVLTLRPKPLATFTVSPNPVCQSGTSTVTFTGTSCPGSTYNWTWPSGVNVLSGSGFGPYSISYSSSGILDIKLQITGPAALGNCTSPLVTNPVTVVAATNAGTNNTLNICSNSAAINLYSVLGGAPSAGGTWTGPSALTGSDLGTFTPGVSSAGLYTYTINGVAPCLAATATINVTQSQSTDASIIYPGGPFCIDNTISQTPAITGAAGGTFSSSPSGLNLNTSTGAFTPSSSSPGTYLITYSIPAAGTCPATTTETYVVITNIPANPSISPNPVCEGSPVVMNVSNGSFFEFFINGVSQGLPTDSSNFNFDNPSSGDVFCVRSYPPPPFTFDGNIIEDEWSNPLAISNPNVASGFAPNNLDALYLQNGAGYLFGALAGQTENNSNNRFLLFIDCQPGGFNNLGGWANRSNAPYVSVQNLNGLITFDPGFNPDFILCMNQANGEAFFDLYDMQNNINYYLGSDINSFLVSSDLLGYQSNGGAGSDQGFEFAVPLSFLGNPTGTISTFVMLVNDPGLNNPAATFISNQFLTPAGDNQSNYGDGFIDFGAAEPNPVNFSLGADCYSEECITVTSAIGPITSFTYPAETCQSDPDINPSPIVGFTGGGAYTSTAGLIINNSTGLIDISASTPDTYTITYTVPAIGCNPAASTDFIVTILPTPSTTPIYHE